MKIMFSKQLILVSYFLQTFCFYIYIYICQRSLLNIFIELTLTLFSKRGLPSGNVFLLLFLATRER